MPVFPWYVGRGALTLLPIPAPLALHNFPLIRASLSNQMGHVAQQPGYVGSIMPAVSMEEWWS